MTVQYNGNNEYKIFIGEKELLLSQDEINEIQGWDFFNNQLLDKDAEELEEELFDLKEKVYVMADELDELITDIEENVHDDMFQEDAFISDIQSCVTKITALKNLND